MKFPVNIVGVDPGLTSAGVCRLNVKSGELTTGTIGSKPKMGHKGIRHRHSVLEFKKWVNSGDVVLIEDYAFGIGTKSSIVDMAEIGGLIRMVAYSQSGTYPFPVPIGSIKKFLTGKGTGKYDEMRVKAYKKWKLEFATTDELVAFTLVQMGLCALNLAPYGDDDEFRGYELDAMSAVLTSLEKSKRLDELQTFAI